MTILEFSEEQQQFHYNNGANFENTNGYKTLIVCQTDAEAQCFADFLFMQHLDGEQKERFATFDEMKSTCQNLAKFAGDIISNTVFIVEPVGMAN